MSSLVEKAYRERIAAMTPAERVARSAAMFQWTREQIARKITAEHGEMSAERLKWMVALKLYKREPQVREWIERILDDVPD